jgi:CDP-glucose 4,6-dehydratase
MDLGCRALEDLVITPEIWRGRSVLLTGHTGFKGSWLALWLHQLGAKVHGFALDPPTDVSLFKVAKVERALASDTRGDINDVDAVNDAMTRAQPEIVLHLAAQPLVRESYVNPGYTFRTNVIGTGNVIDAAPRASHLRAMVLVSTDKVYENLGGVYPFRESDPFGGHDPYSASKAAMEILVASYRASFFSTAASGVLLSTARAGNVIGGGDWAADRIVPDCLRAFATAQPVTLRYPYAVRPWQHVLEPLFGTSCWPSNYLRGTENLRQDGTSVQTPPATAP